MALAGVHGVSRLPSSTVTVKRRSFFSSKRSQGSSNNKALEIHTRPVPRSTRRRPVTRPVSFNGNPTPSSDHPPRRTVADGNVYRAGAGFSEPDNPRPSRPTKGRAGSTATTPSCCARAPRSSTRSVGGFDPVPNGLRAREHCRQHNPAHGSDLAGDTIIDDVFDPSVGWDGFATDTFDGLGSHTSECDGDSDPVTPLW